MTHDIVHRTALLLAALRAEGQAECPTDAAVIEGAAQAAALAGRTVLQFDDADHAQAVVRLGWPAGNAPNEDHLGGQLPPPLSRIIRLVFAVCLRAAWPDPSLPPYPGHVFDANLVAHTCLDLGARADRIAAALDRVLPGHGLIAGTGAQSYLGPAVAALPGPVKAALRRGHHQLPRLVSDSDQPRAEAPVSPPADLTAPDQPPSSSLQVARSLVTALETAHGPLTAREVGALADPGTRAQVEEILAGTGRCLVRTPSGTWTTGYRDAVAAELSAAGVGTLSSAERAVLALVLVHTVALPRALGRHPHDQWDSRRQPVTVTELARNRKLAQTTIRQALRTLNAAGMVDTAGPGNFVPGPALQRLSPARVSALWEDLIIAGRSDGHLARAILERRAAEKAAPTHRESP
ncbi:hypothetical protein ABZ252_26990 [Streptomyces sp. NPDC006175]|uniref:helix-turn-helix domain-containing protein n=1 Tax=Streptomyces sp. NPDC006175 TaxID=3154471 RepID=UPI00339F73A1